MTPEDLREGAWAGERCFIIGGGPSVSLIDLHQLDGRIIAINRALELWPDRMPEPDMWVCHDKNPYVWAVHQRAPKLAALRQAIDKYDGLMVVRRADNELAIDLGPMHRLPFRPDIDLARSFADGVPSASSSGFFAINIAYLLGAEPIVLLGFDCQTEGRDPRHGKVEWWHDGYPAPASPDTYEKHKEHLNALAARLRRVGHAVYNLSPLTELVCWPVLQSLEELDAVA